MCRAPTRLRLLSLALFLGVAPKPLAAQGYRFANIPWGSNAATLKQLLADQGLNFVEVDSEGDYKFKGSLYGYDAVLWGLMSNAGLAKFSITLFTPDEKARQVYRDMKATLSAKYGSPSQVVENYDAPYHEGDGHEEQAIREDKAHFLVLWRQPVAKDTSFLGLQITEKLNLFLAYESPNWGTELDRRRAKKQKAHSPF